MRFKLFATAGIAALAGWASISNGAVLASDDYSTYPLGNVNGRNGGTGFNGGYLVGAPSFNYLNEVRNSQTLSYTGYVTPNGGQYVNLAAGYGGPNFNYVQRTLDVAGAFSAYNDGTRVGQDGTVLYGSFLYNNVAGGQFFLQGTSNQTFNLPTTGADSLFVFQITFGPANVDTFTYFNNPNLATFDGTTGGTTSTSNYAFQTLGFIAPNGTNELRFDNLKLGSTLADVVPITVPEPTSLAAVGLIGLTALRRRR